MFEFRHWNRKCFPTKHILICEDNISNQLRIFQHLATFLDPEGDVQISCVPGSLMAAGIINQIKVDLILLDFDTPNGNGLDFITWMRKFKINIPIITFSGIKENNDNMLYRCHQAEIKVFYYQKEEVINGQADEVIKEILNIK